MEVWNRPDIFHHSDTDRSRSSSSSKWSEKAPDNKVSFCQNQRGQKQEDVSMDYRKAKDACSQEIDDEIIEGNTRQSYGRGGRCGRNNTQYRMSPHHLFQESSNTDLNISRGSSRSRSSLASQSTLPLSLYPTMIDDNTDNENAVVLYNRQYHSLRPQNCSENKDNENSSNGKLDLTEELALSQSPCVFDVKSTGSADSSKCAIVPPSISSFYQEALDTAKIIEDGVDELLFERRQDGENSPETEYSFDEVQTDDDVANIYTPTRNVKSFDVLNVSTSVPATYDAISPFYRAALETPRFAQEEELYWLQQHHKKRSEEEQRAGLFDEISAIEKAGITTISTPSSFYDSALKEAMIAEKEATEDDFKEDEEGRFIISPVNDPTSLILQRSDASVVDELELRSGLIIDPDVIVHGCGDKGGVKKSSTSSMLSSQDIYVDSPLAIPPPILARAKQIHSSSSISPPVVLPVGINSISSNQSSPSYVDDNCESSVTRSITMLHSKSLVVPVLREKSATKTQRSKRTTENAEDDDEELRLAIYLSRIKLSSESSPESEDALSATPSTGGTRSILEEKIEEELYSYQNFESCSPTENNDDFLISQFKEMEEYQKNNSRYERNLGMSCRSSSDRPISGVKRFRFTKVSATSTPSSSGERIQARGRSKLETRGITETRKAISNGSSHVVKCKGCRVRLQAPVDYSLVFCPKCQTVSPA